MIFENTLRYSTFADRSQVENRIESYETLMVPSNLLIGGQNAIPPLLHQLVEAGEIEFYIDPTITEFHRGDSFLDGGELKAWHQKLIEELGGPIIELLEEHDNLVYEDLEDSHQEDIIEAVCDLQENFVQRSVEEQMGKYESALADDISPSAIIPWYVKIEDYPDIQSNREIISYSADNSSLPIKPCIHVDPEFLTDIEARKALAELCEEVETGEVFLWVDGLDKASTSVEEYINVTRLVVEISDRDIDPHAMYGDFFANILMYFGLRGIGFGTYHQEDKEEKLEASGGGNLQRYYFDPVKEFLSIPDAANLGQSCGAKIPPYSRMSDWGDLYRLGEDHDFLKNHFIRTKHHHRVITLQNDLGETLEDLEESHDKFSEPLANRGTTKSAEHLEKWIQAIQSYREEHPEESEEAIERTQRQIERGSTVV